MGQHYVIDIEARFVDHVTGETKSATAAIDNLGTVADQTQKKLYKMTRSKAQIEIDANNSKLIQKIRQWESKAYELGKKKTQMRLEAIDNATMKIMKAAGTAKNLTAHAYNFMIRANNSQAMSAFKGVMSQGRSLAGKTWTAMVKIKDLATSPLTRIKNSLFSIKSLVTAITAGLAAKQLLINPINLADQYSGAKIGFSTLLGEERGQQMMDEIDEFAKATPFKTSGVISNVQKMMAYGWDVNRVIEDMKTIGDAAASTGKGDQGLESIVYALSEIRSKGKLSTQELNQLASAGIKAKAYLAEGLGFGTDDAGMKKLAEALEDGSIGANQAIDLILEGMKEFDGMMDATANETVEGLWSQIQDTFEINIFRRWGQGLQDGAKKGFGTVVDLLNSADEGLASLGDTLYDVGKVASNWVADKLAGAVDDIKDITASPEFQEAGWWGKVKMLWSGVIGNPFAKWWKATVIPWWDTYAVPWLSEKAAKLGQTIGSGLTGGLLTLLGVDYVGAVEDGASIAGGFMKGFKAGFDGSAITDAFVDAISDVWDALPWWGKLLIGGYGSYKLTTGLSSVIGNISALIGTAGGKVLADGTMTSASGILGVLGSTGNATIGGTGVLGTLASLGYYATGGPATAAAYFGQGMSGAAAAGIGLGTVAGIGTGVVTGVSGGIDLYKGYKNDDSVAKESGWWKVGGAAGGAATGAAIGTALGGPLIGTAIGALIGSGIGWLGSKRAKDDAVQAAQMSGSLEELANSESAAAKSARDLLKEMEELAAADMPKHFGDVALSMADIKSAAADIIGRDTIDRANAASQAMEDMNRSLSDLKSADYNLQKGLWMAYMKEEAKLTDDEINALKEDYTAFAKSASALVSDKQFASEASILGILGDSNQAKEVLQASRRYYSDTTNELSGLSKEFNQKLTEALSGGVLSIDEQASLDELRQQIYRVTTQLNAEQYEIKMNIITEKYGLDQMDASSFGKMMDELGRANEEAISGYWEEFGQGSYGLEKGSDAYKTLLEGTMSQIAGALENSSSFGLDKIQSSYAEELGILGQDLAHILKFNTGGQIIEAAAGLSEDIRASLHTMLEYMAPTTEQIRNLEKKYAEAGMKLPDALTSYLNTVEFYEALSAGPEAVQKYFDENPLNIKPKVGAIDLDETDYYRKYNELELAFRAEANMELAWTYDKFDKEWISPDKNYSFTLDALVDANWTYDPFKQEWISPDGEYRFKTNGDVSVDWLVNTFGEKVLTDGAMALFEIQNRYGPFPTTGEIDSSFYVQNLFSGTASAFGINLDGYSYNVPVTVNPIMSVIQGNGIPQLKGIDGNDFRGGIEGGDSALEGFSDGGMVRGGARLIRVAEEGSPEMIIPLSSQRRDRGLQLWQKAGEMMGVPGFRRGGMVGDQDEGVRFSSYRERESADSGSTQVDVGGIALHIHVDGNSGGNIVDAIKAQAGEIAETVAGIINDALGAQFENTPARGGVA